MAEVEKQAGVTAWTGEWRLPTDKHDHQQAVRKQRRRDRREVADMRHDPDNRVDRVNLENR